MLNPMLAFSLNPMLAFSAQAARLGWHMQNLMAQQFLRSVGLGGTSGPARPLALVGEQPIRLTTAVTSERREVRAAAKKAIRKVHKRSQKKAKARHR